MKKYSIVYEDEFLLLIDKPQGLPTGFGQKESLCDYIFEDFPYLKNIVGYNKNEGGLLNRLDNETGGIVFFAKNDLAFQYYSTQMKEEKIEKIYEAIVEGIPQKNEGVINYPISHSNKNKAKMVAIKDSAKNYRSIPQEAQTNWKLLKTKDNISLLEIKIKKGVRHQIRVHLASIGLPIVGDKLYNKKEYDCENHLLYAKGVVFYTKQNKKIEIFVKPSFFL
ncbi:MAG: hypothetical protein A2086_15565 [Spirochaetes bacterium GWD1_27_9]|nr:MAG: hypothetical protein A2Y34_07320 [Spirochaetes bacterium GWC1_27_15]OHD42800.1 MAG: hypothetical protein A2086_15565 [Spirochaetes bacterium GWD1_27_9]